MKQVHISTTVTSYYYFPDDAPVHSIAELSDYVENHEEAQGDWAFFLDFAETEENTIIFHE